MTIHWVPTCRPSVHGPNAHFVGAIDHGELVRALKIDDGALRNQQGPLQNAARDANLSVLARAQAILRIGEQCRHADGASPDIHLAVRKIEFPGTLIHGSVRENQLKEAAATGRPGVSGLSGSGV